MLRLRVGCCRQPWPEQEGPLDAEDRTTIPDIAAAEAVARVALAKPLRSLSLEGNYLGDNGVACLAGLLAKQAADCDNLSLESLNLANNNTCAGAQQVVAPGGWRSLCCLCCLRHARRRQRARGGRARGR